MEANQEISGDLNDLFCNNTLFLQKPMLVADCAMCNVSTPDCCSSCCEEQDECNPGFHVPDMDPIWQLSYQRTYFTFGREDFFGKDVRGMGGTAPFSPGNN